MFYRYEIKNNGIEDILYLYLNMNNEFSKELSYSNDISNLTKRTKNFIKNTGIDFKGDKVYLVIDNIVVKSIDIKNSNTDIEVLKSDLFYSNDKYLVTVIMGDNIKIEVSLKDYLLGVLAANFDNTLELETLKAICVLIRGFIYKEMSEKNCINAVNEYFIYRPISYYKLYWLDNYDNIVNKLNIAVNDTNCLFLTYNNNYILPYFHYSNYGKTIASNKYKYLNSVSSIWDFASPFYITIKDFTYKDISNLLHINLNNTSKIEFLDLDEDYLFDKILIDNSIFMGDKFIEILKLPSRNMSIVMNKDTIRFICRGFGSFYGLSIFGSNELAKNGYDYANIIKYYFPNVTINKYVKEC